MRSHEFWLFQKLVSQDVFWPLMCVPQYVVDLFFKSELAFWKQSNSFLCPEDGSGLACRNGLPGDLFNGPPLLCVDHVWQPLDVSLI